MPVSTEPSTFEFTRDWLVSSETFCRDAMLADAVALDDYRDQARARIHREEAYDEPNLEELNETAPDTPASVNSRPRAIVIRRSDERERVGTGTWGGRGQMLVCVEALIPEEHLVNHEDDDEATKAAKFAAAIEWATQLCSTIRGELQETSGRGEGATPYLNAKKVDIYLAPSFPADGEATDFIAWIYEVEWV